MSNKLHVFVGTLFTLAIFLVFHALLAVTTILSLIFLIPGLLFRWSAEEPKPVAIRGAGVGRH